MENRLYGSSTEKDLQSEGFPETHREQNSLRTFNTVGILILKRDIILNT